MAWYLRRTSPGQPWYWVVLALWTAILATVNTVPVLQYHGIPQHRIPEENTTVYRNLESTCACKYACMKDECRAYTMYVRAEGGVDCHVRVEPLQRHLVEPSDLGDTVVLSDYTMQGAQFYSVRASAAYEGARDACHAEGGQLAVLNSDERKREMADVMLLRGSTENDKSGISVLSGGDCFVFKFTKEGPELHSADCGVQHTYACQRDY